MTLIHGSVSHAKTWDGIEDESVQCVVTSPPYFSLRDYQVEGQLGLEKLHDCLGWARGENCGECYVCKMVLVFRFVRAKLRKDGVCFLNLGDSYAGSGGAGGDYNEGGLREGQPKWKSNFEINRAKDRKSTRWGGGKAPATGWLKPKDMMMVPARVALALQADGWWLRSDIVWSKPNPMPESVTDRPTKAHEYIFLLTKSAEYYFDQDAVRVPQKQSSVERARYVQVGFEKGKQVDRSRVSYVNNPNTIAETQRKALDGVGANIKSVWHIATQSFNGAHFATFPERIPELCIKAGSKKGDLVLDPFLGSGTTGEVALRLGREFVGIELNEKYINEIAKPRLESINPLFHQETPNG